MADQDRPTGAAQSGSGTATDSGSDGRNDGGQSVATAAKGATGKATEVTEKAADAPTMAFKAVLREVQRTVTDEVKAGLTQAASDTVAPAARKAATSALVYATTKAPGLVENAVKTTIGPKLKEAGGAKAVAGTVLSRFPGLASKVPGALSKVPGPGALGSMLGKGKGGDEAGELKGTGRGRRLPLQAAIDVSVPVEVAYNQWTQFEEFPKFMFRVEQIEQKDDTHLIWHEKIWGIRRQWEAEIVEQRPNERIVWRSTSGPQNVGVINFHRLDDPRLTRVQVNLDFQPTGLIEKTGRGWRAAIRALDTDLQRFKAYVEMKDAASGAWRGRVKEGEVQPEDAQQQPQAQQAEGEQRAGDEQQPEAESQPEDAQQQPQAQQPEGEQRAGDEQQPEAESQPQAQQPEAESQPEGSQQAEGEQRAEAAAQPAGEAEPSPAQESQEDGSEPVVAERGSGKG
jgi:uncharacterized membrane protein